MRWLWLDKTGATQPSAVLQIRVYPNVVAMFAIAIESTVGNERNTCFCVFLCWI
jgi:hypothetical protein